MTEYTKVLIESDRRGRIQISCQNAKGYGHGYRLAGPKYLGDHTEPLATRELDERDVKEIRSYLKIWDEIHPKAPATTGGVPITLHVGAEVIEVGQIGPGQPNLNDPQVKELVTRMVIDELAADADLDVVD